MDDGARHCALTGCDEALRTVTGRPERRYCTAAHRAAARQARRAATQGRPRAGSPRLHAVTGLRDAGPDACPDAAVFALAERRDLRVRGVAGQRPGMAEGGTEQPAAPRATPRERARQTMDRLRAQARRTVDEAGQARADVAGPTGHDRDDDVEIEERSR